MELHTHVSAVVPRLFLPYQKQSRNKAITNSHGMASLEIMQF